jgi:hypothetical protein
MSLCSILLSVSGPAWGADPNSASLVANDPVSAMGYVVGQIIRCDQGNYSTEKSPTLTLSCVNMQTNSAQVMIQALIGRYGSDAISTLKAVKNCPTLRDSYYKKCVADQVAKAEEQVQHGGNLYMNSSAADVACKTNKVIGEIAQLRADNAAQADKLAKITQIEVMMDAQENQSAQTRKKIDDAEDARLRARIQGSAN